MQANTWKVINELDKSLWAVTTMKFIEYGFPYYLRIIFTNEISFR